MTLKSRRDKKEVVPVIVGDNQELDALADAIKKLKQVAVFDIDDKPLNKNKRRVTIAQEGGATDPLMYIKIHNALDKLETALRSRAASTEIDFAPNELTKDAGDEAAANRLTRLNKNILNTLDNMIIKRKGTFGTVQAGAPGSVIGRSQFEVVFPYDISELENLQGGAKFEDLLKRGQIIPEYGATLVPPVERKLWRGSSPRLINKAVVVVVKDNAELTTDAKSPSEIVVVDGNSYKKFTERKKGFITQLLGTTDLNWFRESGRRGQPKTLEEFLGMGITLAAAKEYGLVSPRLIQKPQHMILKDPKDNNTEKWHYVFVVGGYSPSGSAKRISQQAAAESSGLELQFD